MKRNDLSLSKDHQFSRTLSARINRRYNTWLASNPPPLPLEYTRSDYHDFMKTELMQYSPAYARGRVVVRGQNNLFKALEDSSVILGLLHHGSWILIGGVIRYVLGLPYSVIASRRNFDTMPSVEATYWENAQKFIAQYYGSELFFSDQPSIRLFRWLQKKAGILGVAFDVREADQFHNESEIQFGGQRLWVQSGPAKLARSSKSLIVPAGIHYVPEHKVHELIFYDAINPEDYASDFHVTQQLFTSLEAHYLSYSHQGFNDLIAMFSAPHTTNI